MLVCTSLSTCLFTRLIPRLAAAAVTSPSLARPLCASPVRRERGGSSVGKARPRQFKRILHPETLEEMPTVRTGLEGTLQAEQVAKEAQEKVWGARDRGRRQAWGGVAGIDRKVEKEAADVRDREQHAHEEVDDHLPEGFTFADLPRFKKIHGWDKENKQLRKLQHLLSHTHKNEDTVILEGKRLIVDAMRAGHHPSVFVFSRLNLLQGFPFDLSRELAMYQIPYRNLRAWSELKTHPGFMAAFSRSSIESKIKASPESLPLTLLVDNVRIPDNLGALLRVAAAAGARRAICLRGCANPWGPKALRAAAGAHFRIPLVCDVSWDKVHWHLAGTNPKVILADLAREDDTSELSAQSLAHSPEVSRRHVSLAERCRHFHQGLVRETDLDGLPTSPAWDPTVRVGGAGMKSSVELSEEEAREILERERKRAEEERDERSRSTNRYRDFSYYEMDILEEYCSLPMASHAVKDLSVDARGGEEVVVVVGGEAEGLSACAKKLAHTHLGERVFVPLRNGVDSLNVASAASVILFHIAEALEDKEASAAT